MCVCVWDVFNVEAISCGELHLIPLAVSLAQVS